jgi:hypothetical protein
MKLKDLIERAKKENFIMTFQPENNIIMMIKTTEQEEVHDLFGDFEVYRLENGKILKVDMKVLVNESAKVLSKHVKPEDVVKNILRDLTPSEIMEVFERAVKKKGKIKTKNGCFEIQIGGKRGHPFTIGMGRVV